MRKLLRSIGFITYLFLFHFSTSLQAQSYSAPPANKLQLPTETYQVGFKWQGDSVLSKWEPHNVLLIPVKLKGCPKIFHMQFDLGSPYSLLYQNKLEAIQLKYPKILSLDSAKTKALNTSLELSKTPIVFSEITVRKFANDGINWQDQKHIEIIGTIGADLIDGKVLVLDYPNQRLTIAENIPAELLPGLKLADFMYARKSILLPAKVEGKATMLFFDTGSSRYTLLTDQKTAQLLAAPAAQLQQSKVKSWDKILTANSLASNANITIANTNLPVKYATYMEGVSSAQIEAMMKLGIGGMTGNKLFLNYKLILDTKGKKFGLMK